MKLGKFNKLKIYVVLLYHVKADHTFTSGF